MALTFPLAWLPIPIASFIGATGGSLFFWLVKSRRRIAVDNVRAAIANGALDSNLNPAAIARRSFANLGRTAMESFRLLHRGFDSLSDRCEVSGGEEVEELIRRSRQEGRGVVFLTGHIGNWELGPPLMSRKFNIDISVVARTQGRLADYVLGRIRSQDGNRVILKHEGARVMLKHLRSGGMLGTLFDQADIAGPGGAKLLFMGKPALTTLGPLKLAARTGAGVVPAFSRRQGDRHILEIAPVLLPPTDGAREWLAPTAQVLNDLLGDFIRRYPDQWMWGHRRWKLPESRPNGS
jgi:KDO2-lipid IV(A) lauroyltransferase